MEDNVVKSADGGRGPQWQGRELEVLLEGMEGRYSNIHGNIFTFNLEEFLFIFLC